MTQARFGPVVAGRIAACSLTVAERVVAGCVEYLSLLEKWNRTINLTALSFDDVHVEQTIDKLIVEPLIGAMLLASAGVRPANWIDLGSGGGSPAIPLRLAFGEGALVMVESRTRKSAFLREVVRRLGLPRTSVLTQRFEEVEPRGDADIVSLRAVRVDDGMIDFIGSLLDNRGYLLTFGSEPDDPRFRQLGSMALPDQSRVHLMQKTDVPRGT